MSRFKKGFQKLGYRTSHFFKGKTFSRAKPLIKKRLKKQASARFIRQEMI